MKYAIYPGRAGTIVATSEDANYPDGNMADDYPQNVWKAASGTQTATLTVPVAAVQSSLGAIALFNTNATSYSLTITDTITSATVLAASGTMSYGRLWKTFSPTANALSASITLTTTATTVECGILRAGDVTTVRNPQYNITEGWKTFSIKKALRNGATYTKRLHRIRSFSYQLRLDRETEFRTLMNLYDALEPDPFAMLLASGTGNDARWAVFGAFEGEPRGSHDNIVRTSASVSILEAA